jgi:hypothetical protein
MNSPDCRHRISEVANDDVIEEWLAERAVSWNIVEIDQLILRIDDEAFRMPMWSKNSQEW